MVSSSSSPYSKKLLPLISWSHWFTFFNIVASVLLSSFYIFSDPAPETAIGYIYLVTNWISHMGFLTFISFVLIIFPIILIYPRTHFIRGLSSVIFTIGLLLLLLDALVYNQLGYHLNASSSEQIISLIGKIINQDQRLFWFVAILLTLGLFAFQLVISNYACKHLRALQKTLVAKYFVSSIIATFFISHIMHIWADANLEYDILKQDTTLPFSYPTTAKALLTKYGLFDRDDYIQRKNSPLVLTKNIPVYPQLLAEQTAQCQPSGSVNNSSFLILTREQLTLEQQAHFSARSSAPSIKLTSHIDNALPATSWFNLLYSLPSIYSEPIKQQAVKPLLFQLLAQKSLASSFTRISNNPTGRSPFSYQWLFDNYLELTDISSLVFANKLNNYPAGLHVLFFDNVNNYQFELFMDALLLAQKRKHNKDIIWVSSLGSTSTIDALTTKPALLITPSKVGKTKVKAKTFHELTSHFDIQNTILTNWLGCNISHKALSNSENISKLKGNRIIANTMENSVVVFNKDKSILVDQNNHFQSYSSQLNAPISVNADFPLLITGMNFIKQFSQPATEQQNNNQNKTKIN